MTPQEKFDAVLLSIKGAYVGSIKEPDHDLVLDGHFDFEDLEKIVEAWKAFRATSTGGTSE